MSDGIRVFALVAFAAWLFIQLVLPRLMRARRIAEAEEAGSHARAVARPPPIDERFTVRDRSEPIAMPPSALPRAEEERRELGPMPRRPSSAPAAESTTAVPVRAHGLRATIIAMEVLGPPRTLRT